MQISWPAKLIVEQQDMSVETLARLRGHGMIEDSTLLRLDFDYVAPGETEASALADFLLLTTDYDVQVIRGARHGLRRIWMVSGRTQETVMSTAIIHSWIRWMVMAGAQHGVCRFDGWGAMVPNASA